MVMENFDPLSMTQDLGQPQY